MSSVKDYYISPHATVEGPVTFGTGCVVLAGARIVATAPAHTEAADSASTTRLRFGRYCIVEEYAEIEVSLPGSEEEEPAAVIGDYNLFAARSQIRGVGSIGEGNSFQPFSRVCGVMTIGDFNVFAAFVCVDVRSNKKTEQALVLSRQTIIAVSTEARSGSAQSSPPHIEGVRPFLVMPRYGSRSVTELPSMAQSLLAAVHGTATAPLATTAEADPSNSDDDHSHDENKEAVNKEALSRSGSSSSSSTAGVDGAVDTVTPQKQRLTAHYLDVVTPPESGRPVSGDPTSAAVEAMLAVLPTQTEKAVIDDVVKRCRYYLTLYGVL